MPNQKQRRRIRGRRELPSHPKPSPPPMSSLADCFMREMTSFLRRTRRPPSLPEQHLKNAAIELLEAMRAVLDAAIAHLREGRGDSELKRIRVEE